MANKSGGASKVSQALNYKNNKVWEKNRLRKLKRALKRHPNNEQITKALSGGVVYRRKTPKARFWSKTRIHLAGLFKAFTGRVNMDIFSNNEKVSIPALLVAGPYSQIKPPSVNEKQMFSLGARAHTRGNLWA